MKKIFTFFAFICVIHVVSWAQKFDLTSTTFQKGDIYVITPKVFFDFNKAMIKPASYPTLDTLVSFLHQHPTIVIEIGTHTDERYSKQYSVRLDQKRSESIMKYLILKGIPKNRLSAKGYGESNLLIKNAKSEQEHAQNRRTELKIIEIKN